VGPCPTIRRSCQGKPSVAIDQEPRLISARFPDLSGKTAVVTGASRGIGAGIARFLGSQGMKLVLCARSQDAGEAVAAELAASGVDCAWVTADIATQEGARRVFKETMERFGDVDVLVNNAARLHSKAFLELDEDEYHQSFELNVRMVYELSLLCARHMAEHGGGSIVHISSVGGVRAHRGLAGYDASKGAMNALTRSMALDLAPHGIRVNAVAPGQTRDQVHEVPQIPLGRSGTAEEVAAMVAFFASDAAAYTTGQVICVDGGLTVQLSPPGMFI
jgi:3-oxoacyl-[acyl-carrier protein] reductase